MPDDSLGYDYNDGGISNQKMALLGLVVEARRTGTPLYLPRVLNKSPDEARSTILSFDAVFFASDFTSFLERWGLRRVPAPSVVYEDRIERGGWRFFEAGAIHLGNLTGSATIDEGLEADFFKSLVPRVSRALDIRGVADQLYRRRGVRTTVQLRIERDWEEFCHYTLSVILTEPEDFQLGAAEIMLKVAATIEDGARPVLVTCDELNLPGSASDIRRDVQERTGLTILFKSDVIPADDLAALTPLESSFVDFELGLRAPRYVGMSRSSFSNLMAFERRARTGRHGGDYIYNLVGPRLGQRVDCGTQIEPHKVCGLASPG